MIGPDGATHSIVAKGSGQTLIFLHGFPLDHRMWLEQLEYFSQRYQVICPELRGFGQSSVEESFSLAQLADDVEVIRSKVAESEKVFCVDFRWVATSPSSIGPATAGNLLG